MDAASQPLPPAPPISYFELRKPLSSSKKPQIERSGHSGVWPEKALSLPAPAAAAWCAEPQAARTESNSIASERNRRSRSATSRCRATDTLRRHTKKSNFLFGVISRGAVSNAKWHFSRWPMLSLALLLNSLDRSRAGLVLAMKAHRQPLFNQRCTLLPIFFLNLDTIPIS